jgi:hypothetical protein
MPTGTLSKHMAKPWRMRGENYDLMNPLRVVAVTISTIPGRTARIHAESDTDRAVVRRNRAALDRGKSGNAAPSVETRVAFPGPPMPFQAGAQ